MIPPPPATKRGGTAFWGGEMAHLFRWENLRRWESSGSEISLSGLPPRCQCMPATTAWLARFCRLCDGARLLDLVTWCSLLVCVRGAWWLLAWTQLNQNDPGLTA